jgi:hypothetical protein
MFRITFVLMCAQMYWDCIEVPCHIIVLQPDTSHPNYRD